jgi:hypothetical protein
VHSQVPVEGLQVERQPPVVRAQVAQRVPVALMSVGAAAPVGQERAALLSVALWRVEMQEQALPVRPGSRQASPAAIELRPASWWDSR